MKSRNLIYDYFVEKMREHADVAPKEISYKKARYVLSRFNVPSWLWMPVLKEMMNTGYLKRENQQAILISDREVDLDRIENKVEEESIRQRTWEEYKEKKLTVS